MSETTFIMVKPDGVTRGLIGEVIGRFERKGLKLTKIRMLTIDEELARRHYAEHVERPFFPELLEFITMGPVVAMEWTGESAVVGGPNPDGCHRSQEGRPRDHSGRPRAWRSPRTSFTVPTAPSRPPGNSGSSSE